MRTAGSQRRRALMTIPTGVLAIVLILAMGGLGFPGCGIASDSNDSSSDDYSGNGGGSSGGSSGSTPSCQCCGCDSGDSVNLGYGSCSSGMQCSVTTGGTMCWPEDWNSSYNCTGYCHNLPDCPCSSSCSGRECGDDGCGGSCGSCYGGEVCDSGTCVSESSCNDTCSSRGCECGSVCGDSCGTCPGGYSCYDGCHCRCEPSCSGRECGDDGCGGSCGSCPTGDVCDGGTCVSGQPTCEDDCRNQEGRFRCQEDILLESCRRDHDDDSCLEWGVETRCGVNELCKVNRATCNGYSCSEAECVGSYCSSCSADDDCPEDWTCMRWNFPSASATYCAPICGSNDDCVGPYAGHCYDTGGFYNYCGPDLRTECGTETVTIRDDCGNNLGTYECSEYEEWCAACP